MNELNIILNGKSVTGNNGESILQLASRYGIEIPTLCNDNRLEPYSSCYVCVVEVDGMRGLQPSCSTKIAEGMKVVTDSEKVHQARKTALDLLVSNHYADCTAPCKQTCPAGVDVQGYISLIEKGLHTEAVELIKKVNPLPAICGRVCVRPCEVACRRNLLDEGAPVGIDYLKRFASDVDLNSDKRYIAETKPSTGKKIAIIGAGPGGLSAAWFLQQEGHSCDIFEAQSHPGGWLRYGIPEYRLPNEIIDREVAAITELGAKIFYNKKFGENLSYKELKENYHSVILAIGSQGGTPIGCEGDDAENVFSGIDFLKNMEATGQRYNFKGKTIAVIGGGNTAMDCCRTSLRCNADKVYVIYRRTEKEMPANPIEIHESKLEGVEYMFLTAPKKVNKNEDGTVKSITCLKMELGEPDASGRRRPVTVEGSDFDVTVDYILAAIGQKTQVNFIDDINKFSTEGELKINKWGDLDADKNTLQTGIKSVFACGDGVTGPATVIEAIAQARKAARSCDQFLNNLPLKAEAYEFISKKENFVKQKKEDYKGHFATQKRHEMPTIPENKRLNFNEVELGYQNEDVAIEETNRCLECGCTEYFTCDLKKHASTYSATQEKFKGDFKKYRVDFNHPFIEIDNNKCILCSRCVRICKEVVGANALGLINRGFETYVAPSLGNKLTDTDCESCGMCISTCPTAAISENVYFKPGPVETESFNTICNYCSVGCEITLHKKGNFIWRVTGHEGMVNKDGNICRFPKFGYQYLNDKSRLTKPLLKKDGKFGEISFEEAFKIIAEKISLKSPEETAVFAGARLSNEEIFLTKKLANEGIKTKNTGSFHYLGRGNGYNNISFLNTDFNMIKESDKVFILGSETNNENAVVGFMIYNHKYLHNKSLTLVSKNPESSMLKKADSFVKVKSYYSFIKAANYYLLKSGKQNSVFISDRCKNFESYKETLLSENFDEMVIRSGVSADLIKAFADDYNETINAILVFSEKEISSHSAIEIKNLAMITGKLGKTAMGIIALKEKNNSEGILNSGIVNCTSNEMLKNLEMGKIKNLLIFGEDPLACACDKNQIKGWLNEANFIMVQDYFMTDTAKNADLILPATFPFETGGSFTNAGRIIQTFEKTTKSDIEKCNIGQLKSLLKLFSVDISNMDITNDMLRSNAENLTNDLLNFENTSLNNHHRLFEYGCDHLVLKSDNLFAQLLNKKTEIYEIAR